MSQGACLKAAIDRQIAILEMSALLSVSQRGAQSGPSKESADGVRVNFMPLAKAAIFPYLGSDAGSDSTSDLSDQLANQLPLQLQFFLPEEQHSRLVRRKMSFTLFNFPYFVLQANTKLSPLAAPKKAKKKKSTGTKKGEAPFTPKKGTMQGQGGGRPVGSKFIPSPGGTTKTYVAPPGVSDLHGKRKLAGADIIPSSTSSAINNEACAKMIEELRELKGKYRKVVLKCEALEKASVKFVNQLQELLNARDGESEMMRNMLQDTQFKSVPIYIRPGIQEPSWCSEVKVRLAAAEAAALTGGGLELDDE